MANCSVNGCVAHGDVEVIIDGEKTEVYCGVHATARVHELGGLSWFSSESPTLRMKSKIED